jgi:xanthine phosphoribosyltransferase
MVFARKYQLLADASVWHVRRVKSPTKGEAFDLAIERREFTAPGRVLIVDDVLAGGTTAEVLGEFVEEAGGTVAGVMIVVDKTFQAGHGRLRARGWQLKSLVPIASLEGGIQIGHAAKSADVATTVGWS